MSIKSTHPQNMFKNKRKIDMSAWIFHLDISEAICIKALMPSRVGSVHPVLSLMLNHPAPAPHGFVNLLATLNGSAIRQSADIPNGWLQDLLAQQYRGRAAFCHSLQTNFSFDAKGWFVDYR